MHSSCSDGALAPAELIEYAATEGVNMLSITDHDSLAAYDDIDPQCPGLPTIVPGIEFSTQWNGVGIHVLGLNVDITEQNLVAGVCDQQRARLRRASRISARLEKLGLACAIDDVLEIAGNSTVGRPHFAKLLVDGGQVPDEATAYRKYLGSGKAGDVKTEWSSLQDVVAWIRRAGGTAVLAHPAKYRMTNARLRRLLGDFVAAGGAGIEVVCGSQSRDTTLRLARFAEDYALAASCGSDFHRPGPAWSAPGRFSPLPESLTTVWEQW